MWVSVSISIHRQMKVLWWYAKYSSVWLGAKASSGTLSSVQRTIWESLLGPGIPFIIKSPVNPKMTPLVEIYTSLIPYPSFLPSPHPNPPSFPHSSPTPFSLTLSPSNNPPRPPCTRGCLALLSTSNLQEDNYMIFFRFTFLFSFSRITNNRLKDI